MSITLGATVLLSAITHQMPLEGDWDYQPTDITFYGVPGSLSIDDAEHGRDITIDAAAKGYANRAALLTALLAVDAYKTTLNDKTLVVVAGADTLTWYHVSFRGFKRNGKAFSYNDGTGIYWQQDGTFVFRQLKRTAN